MIGSHSKTTPLVGGGIMVLGKLNLNFESFRLLVYLCGMPGIPVCVPSVLIPALASKDTFHIGKRYCKYNYY